MKRLLPLIIILTLFRLFCFAQTKNFQNTIFLSKDKPDTNQIISLNDFSCKFNKYNVTTFNDSADAHFLGDTLSSTISKLQKQQSFKINDKEYIEFLWKVYVDSSMSNKIIGLEFNNTDFTNIFWDMDNVITLGKINVSQKLFKPNKLKCNVYPINTGTVGWHNLTIRQLFLNKYRESDAIGNAYYKLYKNYNAYIINYTEKEHSFQNIFGNEGYRFFLLCVFVVSVLFYFIVQKSKSFLWFSIFSLCLLLLAFWELLFSNRDFYYLIYQNILICFVLYSFLAFVVYTFFDKMPKRIYYYLFLLVVLTAVNILNTYFKLYNSHPVFTKVIGYIYILMLITIVIESVIAIIYAVKNKKKRINIIAFGVLQQLVVLLIGTMSSNKYFLYVAALSIYLLPISFLVTFIYIIKDSFSENISKQAEVLTLTQANEKILSEQNITLEILVKERTSEVVKQKEIVELKNKEILDSITYATRIQATILPPLEEVKKYLSNSFILYLPKDIVAGDFYWMETAEKDDNLFFAICDCTGHGVPGAMVSVVCHNVLNRAVREFAMQQPAQILDKTTELVVQAFSLNNADNDEIKDGMDASLCALNTKTLELQWAGANNSLWIIKPNGELIEYKADKQTIGRTQNLVPFTNHNIQLEKGDTLYLFTDGYADQFGGELNKKFQRKALKELLISIHTHSMEQQGEIILNTFEAWRGKNEQTDDVCVMGVRV